MKSAAGVVITVLCLSASSGAGAQGFRGGVGGAAPGGFAGTARSGMPAGGISQAPLRSVNPGISRPNSSAAQPHFGIPRGPGLHQIPPRFVPFGGGKFVNPFVPFVSPHFHHGHFFPHRHGWVVADVPLFWGSTIITNVAPGAVRAEPPYLPDPSSGARVRESGQLAPFDPTPLEVVDRMLALADVRKNDVVYDLGSGDGRVLIAVAKKYGARGVGFETDGGLVKLARENARRAGVEKLVEIRQQDFLSADLSAASVVTLYLSYDGNLAVRERLKRQLKPGARVVSYTFDMGDWPPKIAESYRDSAGDTHMLYLWEISEPALAGKNPAQVLEPYPTRNTPLIIEVR